MKQQMKLNNSNYYTPESNKKYLSVSQYKDFFGTLGRKGCEAKALAKLNGQYKEEPSTAMLVGSYIDSYVEGTLESFKENNPDIFKKDGSLKSDYIQAESIISRIEKDRKFMQYLSGEKQIIMTAEIFGVEWKIKMDSYIKHKAIVDLKIVKDIYETFYVSGFGRRLNFIENYGYDFQLAIYQKVVELNTGEQLPCFIAVADKTKTPAIELIQITQSELDSALVGVESGVERIKLLKAGEIEPDRCGRCDFCKETKVITKPILMSALIQET